MIAPLLTIPEDWWDGRRQESFFPHVYYDGDNSREGCLNAVPLPLAARTARECEVVEAELREHFPDIKPADLRILDCPCGQGRHSIHLARLGYQVVGADLCPAAIAEARKALASEPEEVQRRCHFVEDDMRSLRRVGGNFSAVINMFFSFGFFSEEGNLATLQSFHSVLAPKGLLLIHTDVNRHLIDARQYGDRTVRTLIDGSRLVIEEHWNSLTDRLDGAWTITTSSGSTRSASYSVRIYKSAELQSKLVACGFDCLGEKPVPIFGLKLPVHKSQELLYIAMRA